MKIHQKKWIEQMVKAIVLLIQLITITSWPQVEMIAEIEPFLFRSSMQLVVYISCKAESYCQENLMHGTLLD